VGAADNLNVVGYEARTAAAVVELPSSVEYVLIAVESAAADITVDSAAIGTLTSLCHICGGAAAVEVEMRRAASVALMLWPSVNGATVSGEVAGLRRRRMHRKMTSRISSMTRAPRTPPTMAAIGGPLLVAAAD